MYYLYIYVLYKHTYMYCIPLCINKHKRIYCVTIMHDVWSGMLCNRICNIQGVHKIIEKNNKFAFDL